MEYSLTCPILPMVLNVVHIFISRQNNTPPVPLTEPFSVNTSQDTDLNIANKPTAASCSNNGDGKAM